MEKQIKVATPEKIAQELIDAFDKKKPYEPGKKIISQSKLKRIASMTIEETDVVRKKIRGSKQIDQLSQALLIAFIENTIRTENNKRKIAIAI